ncbi:O-antigen ligase family protein [Sinomonas sp. P10A9]|uniref:O-antigen ligase family protein n=1 Tax=Sinomonas puerhi TaxID=3238584 RepID=A0AB39L918_9MICC
MRGFAALRQHLDAVSMLTLFLLACAVPSYLSFTVIGSVGRPSVLVCLLMFAWWLAHQLQRPFAGHIELQPVRWMLLPFVGVVLASYIGAMFRGLPEAEVSPADNGLLRVLAWCGLFLVAHDGLRTWEHIVVLVRRVALAGGLMALLGLLQFGTKRSLLSWLVIPWMSGDYGGVDQRAGFVRAAGTATHPLEYGAVLSITLPLAVALAVADTKRGPVLRWGPAVLIASASILSVSRSALIAVVIATAVLAASWTARQRVIVAGVGTGLFAAVYFLVPGMAGTIVGMFSGAADDSSVASRVNGYDVAFGMVQRLPLFGRGFGTLMPSYVYLDNQYIGVVVELGLFGLAAVLALIIAGIVTPWRARRFSPDRLTEQIGAGVVASVSAGAVTLTFFDGLAFPLSSGFLFLVLGAAGAYRRISRAGRAWHAVGGSKAAAHPAEEMP